MSKGINPVIWSSIAVLLLTGCSARLDGPTVPRWARTDNPPVERFDNCHQMRKAGWRGGASYWGSPAAQQTYELNLHLAWEPGHACPPRQSLPEGSSAESVGRIEDRSDPSLHRPSRLLLKIPSPHDIGGGSRPR